MCERGVNPFPTSGGDVFDQPCLSLDGAMRFANMTITFALTPQQVDEIDHEWKSFFWRG